MKPESRINKGAVLLAALLTSAAWAEEPQAPSSKPAQTAVAPEDKPESPAPQPLDLRIGDVRKYMTPEEFRALINASDDANTVIVKADAPLVPMKSALDVPGGILAPFWALAHPTQAWRLFLPDARIDITKIPPPENKIPPPEFRWGP